MTKILPRNITSYDLIKTLAIMLMLVDHIGFYFFFEDTWWRVFGRMCVPIWFFLIGYANTRALDRRFLIGGLILVAGDMIAGLYVFPANILFTMLIMRFVLDTVTGAILRGGQQTLWFVAVVALMLTIPSMMIFEYGLQGLTLALFGWFIRHQGDEQVQKVLGTQAVTQYSLFAFVTFIILQWVLFGMDVPQFWVLSAGCLAVFAILMVFKPMEFPGLTARLGAVSGLIRFTGRRTLEIYVGHLLLFKVLGMLVDPERFSFLNWTWFYVF